MAVLAVQGAFIEHERRLRQLGCTTVELRQASDLRRGFDGLVLPGGESTAQSKLLRDLGMLDPLRELITAGLPVLGTCAGLILLAARVEGTGDLRGLDEARAAGRARVDGLRTLDVTVERNAYGRQLGSFHAQGALVAGGGAGTPDAGTAPLPLTFIRAPRITAMGPAVHPLVTLDGQPVAVQQGAQVAAAFHPELDDDDRLYRRFLDLVR
ncbi:MAG: pyridoxal 5'-phosphate synthase glutaminase subunit PdxT [Eggerthellaceae bacterium]|nr:pyridoxal 5'-phosphate synthase glutaminase subunit PdxT [Eggerthellaceae bacterium]